MIYSGRSDFRLPDLRVIEIERLVPHEQVDPRRSGALGEQLRGAGILRNPPVVAPVPDAGPGERYVVLDGANRITTLREAGYPHVFAQVVRYDGREVRLSTWHHAVAGCRSAELERALAGVSGLERRKPDLSHARALLARREAIAFLVRSDGAAISYHGGQTLGERNALLNAIVDRYRSRYPYHRVTRDSMEEARSRYPDVTSLLVFPHFEPEEILEIARIGARLPAGITRHVVPWRALRVNLPLEVLSSRERSLEEKNAWLRAWVVERMEKNAVRFYEESTVLFDE